LLVYELYQANCVQGMWKSQESYVAIYFLFTFYWKVILYFCCSGRIWWCERCK